MASSLPDLSHLAAHPLVPTGVMHFSEDTITAMIYIVADMLGDEPNQNDPLLMLFAVNNRTYQVPTGALKDGSGVTYATLRRVVKRRFCDTILHMGKDEDNDWNSDKRQAWTEILAMTGKDSLEQMQDHTEDGVRMVRYRVHVPRTSVFEALLSQWNAAFNPSASVDVKRITNLLGAKGYTWVRKSALEEAMRNPTLNAEGHLRVRDTDGGNLWLGPHAVGTSRIDEDGPWEPGSLSVDRLFLFDS